MSSECRRREGGGEVGVGVARQSEAAQRLSSSGWCDTEACGAQTSRPQTSMPPVFSLASALISLVTM